MPGLNGVELARKMRAKHHRLMVLLISGSAPDINPTDDIEVLPKPYNQAHLSTKVRELLKRGSTI
jgi:DNA-binding response OmpR family regulator